MARLVRFSFKIYRPAHFRAAHYTAIGRVSGVSCVPDSYVSGEIHLEWSLCITNTFLAPLGLQTKVGTKQKHDYSIGQTT